MDRPVPRIEHSNRHASPRIGGDARAAATVLRSAVAASIGAAALLASMTGAAPAQAAASDALQLEMKIPLETVKGRIDHMAVDAAHGRLFVAELGNDSVAVVDINAHKLLRVISGLKEPQGVGYVASTDTLYVANARDGSVQLFRGDQYAPAGAIKLGGDADNVRLDATTGRLFVGYGNGALAVIDPADNRKLADIPLDGHPESFQLAPGGARIYVNVPSTESIAVIDVAAGKPIARWPTQGMNGNFAMALDDGQKVVVAFRKPARLVAFSTIDSGIVASIDTCGDVDDVFVDAKRQRIYVSCGEGFVDVIDKASPPYRRVSRMPTVAGARTSLFVPELDRLFVAVRATGAEPAAIWVFRPVP
jgi:DNA-binding beta-propeller fold protein YncE